MRTFLFRWEFDGDTDALLKGVREGHAISLDGAGIPILNAMIQGRRLLLPLPHRIVEVDLTHAISVASDKNHVTLSLTFRDTRR